MLGKNSKYCSQLEVVFEEGLRSRRGEIEGQYIALRRRGKSEGGSGICSKVSYLRLWSQTHSSNPIYTPP